MVNRSRSLATTFAALGSPARLSIVDRLRAGEAAVTELARPLPMSAPAVSRHLRVLERAGLVTRRVDGRVHWIALDPRPLDEARRWLVDGAAFWEGRLDALEATLLTGETHELEERTA